ncbi:HlyD family secretion protein [Anaeromyxobacter oryzae]|uniref:Hemolysin D n=1 Tax=Anaeromyxobacter oryzae TaxID=2918170 RepID=A0ABN6MRF7_9BACT|nr:HlyD family secretion protein [Anaeromyxobacter oryzae]BDG03545.1 hemolysin D [Anaeromyxobacter oryzae]
MDAEVREEPRAGGPAKTPPAEGTKEKRGALRRRVAIGVAVVVTVALLYWLHARRYEDTDDAQIDGYVGAVSSRVPGTVTAVRVEDNQRVEAGAVLVELDPTDLEVAVAQARAAVAQAQAAFAAEQPSVSITETSNLAAVRNAEADVESARTDLEAAQRDAEQADASARLAESQLARAKQLVEGDSLAPAEYDQRSASADVARAAAQASRERLAGRRARLDAALSRQREILQNAPRQLVSRQATVQVRQANLELGEAQLRQAQLNLGYAKVLAPAAGIVGKRTVNVGDRIQPGQQLMALTQTGELWVTANFRETQVRLMKAGLRADFHVDALDRDYRGVIESFAGATGSRYSLLPPENASGNYVKVVQRIPVRVRIDPGQPELERLRPGMSVEVAVEVR